MLRQSGDQLSGSPDSRLSWNQPAGPRIDVCVSLTCAGLGFPWLGAGRCSNEVMAVNKVSSPSLVVVTTLVVAFVASVVFYLALSPERNAHTGPGATQAQSTGSR